jgi:hypothetical protein
MTSYERASGSTQPSAAYYRELAETARNSDDTELADRLDEYSEFLDKGETTERYAETVLGYAWTKLQELARTENGDACLFVTPQASELASLVLPRLRKMLVGRDNLDDAVILQSQDETAHVVPMEHDMLYVETYSRITHPISRRQFDEVDVQVLKGTPSLSEIELHDAGARVAGFAAELLLDHDRRTAYDTYLGISHQP